MLGHKIYLNTFKKAVYHVVFSETSGIKPKINNKIELESW